MSDRQHRQHAQRARRTINARASRQEEANRRPADVSATQLNRGYYDAGVYENSSAVGVPQSTEISPRSDYVSGRRPVTSASMQPDASYYGYSQSSNAVRATSRNATESVFPWRAPNQTGNDALASVGGNERLTEQEPPAAAPECTCTTVITSIDGQARRTRRICAVCRRRAEYYAYLAELDRYYAAAGQATGRR